MGSCLFTWEKNNDSIHNRDLPDLLNNPRDSQAT